VADFPPQSFDRPAAEAVAEPPAPAAAPAPEAAAAPTPEPAPAPAKPAPAPAPAETYAAPTRDDFAAMFAATEDTLEFYDVGERVKAPVVSIGSSSVFVDLGGKSEGILDIAQVLDKDGKLKVGIGDIVEAYVVSVRGGVKLALTLSAGAGSDGNDELIADAQSQGIPVEGKVTGTNKGGFDVQVFGRSAFCPISQIDFEVGEPESWIDKTLRFVITRVDEGGRNLVVSRTQLLKEEREVAAMETMATLAVDQELDGIVTRIMPFGAFVDIGGIEGMVHVSELSYTRVENPEEIVSTGQKVRVKVMRIEPGADSRSTRIGLSMRALSEDPFMSAISQFSVGSDYPGVVTRMERYGAFIELAPGLEGLAHISEITSKGRISHPQEVLNIGDNVNVQLIDLDPLKRQLKLSLKATEGDPWSAITQLYQPGQTVQVTSTAVVDKGVRVDLADGFGAFIPLSLLPEDERKTVHTRFRPGTEFDARVVDVDAGRRRITLTRREDDESGRQDFTNWKSQERSNRPSMGNLGELLAQKGFKSR
jgi:small subunit ribosomal protein S1